MKAHQWQIETRRRRSALTLFTLFTLSIAAGASASDARLVLTRGQQQERTAEYRGVVELAIDPGFDGAHVAVSVDGQKVADNLLSPYRISVDLGPAAVEHRIVVTASGAKGKKIRWSETINRGKLPLSVRLERVDAANQLFEAVTTSPEDDPVAVVQLWDNGTAIATDSEAPFRFTVPESLAATGFVQVTARTRSGDEAADFWSPAGAVHVEEMQVRTVPIFVSVVDRDGQTRDDLDRSKFRIIDNESEGQIIEFGKAFDQPISIALLVDASNSMTFAMAHAAKAASDFVARALKPGDRCSITAVQDVPRRLQPLTAEHARLSVALASIKPHGSTALYDAVASAIRELADEKNRRAIVVMTDGGDTASNYSFDEVHKMARQAGIPLYFIAYESDDTEARDLERLSYLAAETGGFVATATQKNLTARYNDIEKDLRAQFAILYRITDFAKSNQYRRVRVVIDSPKLTARTIKGYFTP